MAINLSIIILNYNTKKLTLEAVRSIEQNYKKEVREGEFEVIVADNASDDGSLDALHDYKKNSKIKRLIVLDNKINLGFSKGNNQAIIKSEGKYILILNPDTLVKPGALNRLIDFLNINSGVGAVTCKILLPDGKLDQNCVRGFPTPWNSLCHFSGLSKLFPASRFFSGYLQSGWRDMDKIQEVDAIEGAFMMVPRQAGEKIGWLDEDYFFYGEDLQFCYDLKKEGYKIFFVPDVSIIHYGGVSSGIKKQSEQITTANKKTKKQVQGYRFEAMRIFFEKNYAFRYPKIIGFLVGRGINFLYKLKSSNLD